VALRERSQPEQPFKALNLNGLGFLCGSSTFSVDACHATVTDRSENAELLPQAMPYQVRYCANVTLNELHFARSEAALLTER